MRRRVLLLPAVLAPVAIAALVATTIAIGDPLSMVDLRVYGGENAWHAENEFRLDWDREADGPVATAVAYLLRDETGTVLGPIVRNTEEVGTIERIRVPNGPGTYTVEAWLEGPHGEEGPHSTANLRFDDVPPPSALPIAPPSWIAAGVPAVLRIQHPAAPLPVSGIRGYAVSVDRGTLSAPCALATRCTLAETDLTGGIDDDTVSLGTLPEGVNVARVVAVSGSGVPSRTVESAEILVDATPPAVILAGLPDGWVRTPVRLTATATDRLSGMSAGGPAGPFTAISVDGRRPSLTAGDSVSTLVGEDGAHSVAFYARDAAGNVADGQAGAPLPSSAVVRIDESPPRVAFAPSQDPADPERVEATVSDPLAGPSATLGAIGVRPAGTRVRFEGIPTVVVAGKLIARWDSDAYPPGTYEFAATGYDTAGNSASSVRRTDGTRMVLPNPIKRLVTIESGLGGKRLVGHRSVSYRRGARFGGKVITASGSPLAGTAIAVVETFDPGAEADRRTTVVRTGADGTFAARLAPGPSRHVVATFAGDRMHTRASGRRVDLRVLAAVRLFTSASKAAVGGAPVIFSGRIARRGASIPPSGLAVELQFRYPGAGWSEFRTIETDGRGRFRYPYAFSDDDSRGVRFQFRAFVPAQDDWPYEAGYSRPVIVTGR